MKLRILGVAALLLSACNTPTWAQKTAKPVAKPKTDPRADATIQKMVAAYDKLGDFSMTSLDTTSQFSVSKPLKTVRRRATGRFGKNGRAALKVETINEKGKTLALDLVRLNDGTTFFNAQNRRPVEMTPLDIFDNEANADATTQFFRASAGLRSISLALRLKTLALPETRSQLGVLKYKDLPGGESQIEGSGASAGGSVAADFHFSFAFAATGFLKKIDVRLSDGQATYFLNSQLSTPLALRGANNFVWKTFAPAPDPNFSIPDDARAPFERAAKLYGSLNSLSLRATSSSTVNGKTTHERGGFDWERRGLLRYENQTTRALVVVDHKTRWNLRYENATPLFSSAPLDTKNKSRAVTKILGFHVGLEALGRQFEQLLHGEPLVIPTDTSDSGFTHLRARVLPAQTLNNEICNVIEVIYRTKAVGAWISSLRFESLYYFAQNDGRLLRVSDRVEEPDEPLKNAVLNIEVQTFNAALGPETFRFIKPKGALPDAETVIEIEIEP